MSDFDIFLLRVRHEVRLLKSNTAALEATSIQRIQSNFYGARLEEIEAIQGFDLALQMLDGLDSFLDQVARNSNVRGQINFSEACNALLLKDMRMRLAGQSEDGEKGERVDLF